MAEKAESTFKRRARRDLGQISGCWVTKTQQVSIRGTPDFLICLNSYFIAIELKKDEASVLAEIQSYTLAAIRKAGGMALVSTPKSWPTDLKLIKALTSSKVQKLPRP